MIHWWIMDRVLTALPGNATLYPKPPPPIAYKSTSRNRSSPIRRYIFPRECHKFKVVGKRESRIEDGNVCDKQESAGFLAIPGSTFNFRCSVDTTLPYTIGCRGTIQAMC